MGKPLNLYQETGWGVPAKYGGPKSWHELMTGFFLPSNVRAGQNVGFLWVNGERRSTFDVTLSGETKAAPGDREFGLTATISGGGMIPLNKTSGTFEVVVSGNVAKNEIDTFTFSPKLSGGISGIQFIPTTFQFQFGNSSLSGHRADTGVLQILPSGFFSGQSRDACSLTVSLSGGFVGIIKDTINTVSFELTSIQYVTDETVIVKASTSETLDSISVELMSVEYKNALGG